MNMYAKPGVPEKKKSHDWNQKYILGHIKTSLTKNCYWSLLLCLTWNNHCVFAMLLTGSMWSDGRLSIGQCDLVESWDNLSLSQRKNLNYRYQMGCECRVSQYSSCMNTDTCHWLRKQKLWLLNTCISSYQYHCY